MSEPPASAQKPGTTCKGEGGGERRAAESRPAFCTRLCQGRAFVKRRHDAVRRAAPRVEDGEVGAKGGQVDGVGRGERREDGALRLERK